MRKICCFLSVVLTGMLLSGCQIILFPETREDESGQQQNPPSGQNGSSEDPSNRVAYTVSGIKPSVALTGHSIYVTFTARTPEKEIKSFSSTAVVLRVSGDTLWLKTSQGPYYVIKK